MMYMYTRENEYENEEEEEEDNVYDPEENSRTRFTIVICELYNKKIHGLPDIQSDVASHYLVLNRFKRLRIPFIQDIVSYMNAHYLCLPDKSHDIFRNYKYMIYHEYIKPQIAECVYLQDQSCVAILKTFWIKWIQRKWKNICKERKQCMEKRCTLHAMRYKELHGTWPDYCMHYPLLKGMLSN